ncbi:MAG: non-hydrolyzing UDP-N-acetylglucosamine 2-epimerase, partial [Usitatibacter sp.]
MSEPTPQRVMVLFGTRPEVIKLAPVIRELQRHPERFAPLVVSTGQHREMVDQALDAFELKTDIRLDAMSAASSLGQLTARLFADVDKLLDSQPCDSVVVQGDTTSAMVGAMSAFYHRIRVAHVEAGLRTFDKWAPFPEEINRSIIGQVADLHFAPTARSAENLKRAGVADAAIHVTGNTAVDAILWASARVDESPPAGIDPSLVEFVSGKRLVLVTSHRRESFGKGLENICSALLAVVQRYPDAAIVYPVHLNPNVRGPVNRMLGGHPRIKLIEPTGYLALVWLMKRSFCIFTDSGGIQEEAPSLGKPVLIMRENTERPEVVEAGCARLVGTAIETILDGARSLF